MDHTLLLIGKAPLGQLKVSLSLKASPHRQREGSLDGLQPYLLSMLWLTRLSRFVSRQEDGGPW